MECEDYQNYFDEYHSNILSEDLHEKIRKHIEACAECSRINHHFEIIRNNGLISLSYDKGEPGEKSESAKMSIMRIVREKEIQKKSIERKYVKAGYAGQLTGTTLDNYEIYEEIGKGGRGNVYRAKQISMDRIVALKVLKERYAKDDGFINKFLHEARSAGKLNHVNMITVHHVGTAEGRYFFAMEYVDGETIHEMLQRLGTIEPAEAVKIIIQVIEALKYAHSKGIIHRDVKPDNIMIDRMGIAKLADLGIATSIEEQSVQTEGPRKTTGTPYYMSPEQVRGAELDFRTDIYSLGATLFHITTGEVPFKGEDTIQTLKLRLIEDVPSVHEINPRISPKLDSVIRKMMALNPEKRFSDYNALISSLEKAGQGRGLVATRPKIASERNKVVPSRPYQRKTGAYIGIGIAAAVFIVVSIVFFAGSSSRNKKRGNKVTTVTPDTEDMHDSASEHDVSEKPEGEERLQELLTKVRLSTDYEDNIEKLRMFQSHYPSVSSALVEKTIREQMDRQSRMNISRLKEQAMADTAKFEKEENYGACLEIVDSTYKGKFAEYKAQREFDHLRRYFINRADARFSAIQKEADTYTAQHKFEKARTAIKQALALNMPGINTKVKNYLSGVEKQKKQYTAMQREKEKKRAAGLTKSFLKEVDPLIHSLELDQAMRKCGDFSCKSEYGPIVSLVAQKKKDCEALLSLYEKAKSRIMAMKGKEYRFILAKGGMSNDVVIKSVENDMIKLEIAGSGGVEYGLKFDKLAFAEILKLSEMAVGRSRDPEAHISIFLGHMIEGNMERAEKRLRAADILGIQNKDYYKGLLARRKKTYREESAAALVDRIAALIEKEDYANAAPLIEQIENEYGDTLCYAKNAEMIADAKTEIDYLTQAGDFARFFKGRVEAGNDRDMTIRYDFSDVQQMDDWRPVLGTWKVNPNRKALVGSLGGAAKEKDWMVWTSISFPFRFSGEIYFSARIHLERAIRMSWDSCGLVFGKYRVELPRFMAPKKNRTNQAGLSKKTEPGDGQGIVKGKMIEHVNCSGKQSFDVSIQTEIKEGEAFLTVTIDGQAFSVPLADGAPKDAQLGFYSTRLSEVAFSDVVIQGTVDKELLSYIHSRERIKQSIAAQLGTGREVNLCAGQNRNLWINTGGLWDIEKNMVHGKSRGMMIYDFPLEQYEISATLIADPDAKEQRYNHGFYLLCGADTERILRAGFTPDAEGFCGWDLGEGFDFRRRYHEQGVPGNEIKKTWPAPIEFRIRYTQQHITYFLNKEKVFFCPNPHPLQQSCAGLMIQWSGFWFKDVMLRKL